jgi:hypothetical protein
MQRESLTHNSLYEYFSVVKQNTTTRCKYCIMFGAGIVGPAGARYKKKRELQLPLPPWQG